MGVVILVEQAEQQVPLLFAIIARSHSLKNCKSLARPLPRADRCRDSEEMAAAVILVDDDYALGHCEHQRQEVLYHGQHK